MDTGNSTSVDTVTVDLTCLPVYVYLIIVHVFIIGTMRYHTSCVHNLLLVFVVTCLFLISADCISYQLVHISPYIPLDTTNNHLEVEADVVRRIVLCRFLGGFTGTAECQIEYSTQEDLSGSVVDTGSSTSGDTVTVNLTATLNESTTYYYLVTATAEGVSVTVQGFFRTSMLKAIQHAFLFNTHIQNISCKASDLGRGGPKLYFC